MVNGRLEQDVLAPIAGGGYLRKDAAAAWNAMAAEILREEGVYIRVNGPDSAYRPFDRQRYWKSYWCARGACQNAATPGTSNHGWGLAVDVPDYVQALIAKYGRKYGWAKEWSDAPWEPWHFTWRDGIWAGKNPGPGYTANKYPSLKKGDKGGAVKRAQKHLTRWNRGVTQPEPTGYFGPKTRQAVIEFQIIHDLKPDGEIGPATWKRLRKIDKMKPKRRSRLNRRRLAAHKKEK